MVTAIAGMVASGPCRVDFRSPGGFPNRHGSPWKRHGFLNDGIQEQGAVLLSLHLLSGVDSSATLSVPLHRYRKRAATEKTSVRTKI